MTYPDASVTTDLETDFVGLKIDMLARHPDFKQASGNQKVIWAPAMIFRDGDRELRRYVGWLPADSFRAELRFVRGQRSFDRGDFAAALTDYSSVLEMDAAAIRPEALYWQGIAGFLAGKRDMAALKTSWELLAKEYPDNRFGMHASVIADVG